MGLRDSKRELEDAPLSEFAHLDTGFSSTRFQKNAAAAISLIGALYRFLDFNGKRNICCVM
jgi:hypothetical protein